MESCKTIEHEGHPPSCPMNGQTCKPVGRITLESLLKPDAKSLMLNEPYYFCDAPDCPTVYISALASHLISKDKLTVRVGIKEKNDPIPICYCFQFDRKAIWDDIRAGGDTEIPEIITQRVKSGECRCDITNPSGTCCLGNVYRAVKDGKRLRDAGSF
jgi:hypothetical protein